MYRQVRPYTVSQQLERTLWYWGTIATLGWAALGLVSALSRTATAILEAGWGKTLSATEPLAVLTACAVNTQCAPNLELIPRAYDRVLYLSPFVAFVALGILAQVFKRYPTYKPVAAGRWATRTELRKYLEPKAGLIGYLGLIPALELGSAALALRKLSAPSKLSVAPAGVGMLNAAVQVAVLAALLPESTTDLNDALKMLRYHLSKLSFSSQPQQLRKLQLLTPLALVLYSRIGDPSDMALLLADQCILNLKSRPVAVYGVASLRPTAAANIILEAFGREIKQSDHLGGGQLESARRALHHSFGERDYWFRPICAAQAAFALLCLRDQQANSYSIQAAVKDLRRRFGYIPNFQQAQPHPQLQTIKTALTLLEEGEITALSAARLLVGEGGSV